MQGQKEIRDSLHRGVVILERAEGQSRKEVEQMHETRQIFSEQLDEINNIDPSEWSAAGIEEELSKALAKVDQAQAIYTQSRAKIDALRGQDLESQSEENSAHEGQTAPNVQESFGANLIRGFAFNLPLILAIFLELVLFHILK